MKATPHLKRQMHWELVLGGLANSFDQVYMHWQSKMSHWDTWQTRKDRGVKCKYPDIYWYAWRYCKIYLLVHTILCHSLFVMPYSRPCFVIVHWVYIYVCGFDQGRSLSFSLIHINISLLNHIEIVSSN